MTSIPSPSDVNLNRPARCACGHTGTLRELRAHLRAALDGHGHAITSHGDRAIELSVRVRRAAIAWATADREAKRRAHIIELIELEICELAAREDEPGGILVQIRRDEAAIAFRAAVEVRDEYEETWRQAARDLLEEMCPEDEDASPIADIARIVRKHTDQKDVT